MLRRLLTPYNNKVVGGERKGDFFMKDVASPPAPSPKDPWFPTFVGMVKGGKGNQFGEGEET